MEICTTVGDKRFKGFNKIPAFSDIFEKAKQRFEGLIMNDDELLTFFKRWAQHRSCLHCMKWDEIKEVCQKFNQRPPAKVIVNGCQFHDFMPF